MTAVDVDALEAARAAAHIVANWSVNFSPDQPDALENMIAATLAPLLAAVRARDALRAAVAKLIAFYDRHEYSSVNVDDLRALLADVDGGQR